MKTIKYKAILTIHDLPKMKYTQVYDLITWIRKTADSLEKSNNELEVTNENRIKKYAKRVSFRLMK